MYFSEIYRSWKELQRSKYRELWRILGKNFFVSLEKKRVLDLGCGSGYFESFLKGKKIEAKIIGADVEFTKIRPFVLSDGDHLPFRNGIFDVLICIDAIHLIREKDFRRILSKNGIALISVFFNNENYEQRVTTLRKKLGGFEILLEFEVGEKEKDYFVVAKNTKIKRKRNTVK